MRNHSNIVDGDQARRNCHYIGNDGETIPISVNWHLSPYCNYHCKYCFGHFRGIKKFLDLEKSKELLEHLGANGTQKITFSGGEPFLHPHLGKLVRIAKDLGITTMIVSNGSLITGKWLRNHASDLDWLGLSVDSVSEATQKRLGRGNGSHVNLIRNLAPKIIDLGIRLKINTVITAYNWNEYILPLIRAIKPERWKVFKILPIRGENDRYMDELRVTDEQFIYFIDKHKVVSPIIEKNEDMYGSYLMIDPLGRLFQNTTGELRYSNSIIDIGIKTALRTLGWDYKSFLKRGGFYKW